MRRHDLPGVTALIVICLTCCSTVRRNAPTEAAPVSTSPKMTQRDFCARLVQCPQGYGVCIRCVGQANPTWVWNDSAGTAHELLTFSKGPDCDRFVFDERGNPVQRRAAQASDFEDAVEWSYDERGRVVRIRTDEVAKCERRAGGKVGATYWESCGSPDGKWDSSIEYRWRDDESGSTVTVADNERFLRHYDLQGRLVRDQSARGFVEFEYGMGAMPTRERAGTATVAGARAGTLGKETDYERRTRYDQAGRRVEMHTRDIATGQARVTRWTYDARGNETSEQTRVEGDPAGKTWWATSSHEYDAGRPIRSVKIHDESQTTTFTTFERVYGPRFLQSEQWSYSKAGVVQRTGRTVWLRDSEGRVLRKSGVGKAENYECLLPLWDELVEAADRR